MTNNCKKNKKKNKIINAAYFGWGGDVGPVEYQQHQDYLTTLNNLQNTYQQQGVNNYNLSDYYRVSPINSSYDIYARGGSLDRAFLRGLTTGLRGALYTTEGNSVLNNSTSDNLTYSSNDNGLYSVGGSLINQNPLNSLKEINEGGTHEENPNNGVQVGINDNGQKILLEENETQYGNFVFSDRLKVPKELVRLFGVRKSGKEMSYSALSKKINEESEERPNDPIAKRTRSHLLEVLANLQETQKAAESTREEMKERNAKRKQTQERINELNDIVSLARDINLAQERNNMLSGISSPQESAEQKNHNNQAFDKAVQQTISDITGLYPQDNIPINSASSQVINNNDNNVSASSSNDQDNTAKNSEVTYVEGGSISSVLSSQNPELLILSKLLGHIYENVNNDTYSLPQTITNPDGGSISESDQTDSSGDKGYVYKGASLLQLAPIIGAGVQTILSLFNKYDSSDYDTALKNIGNTPLPTITAKGLGNYMRYEPVNIPLIMNRQQAEDAATRAAIISNTNPVSRAAWLLQANAQSQFNRGKILNDALDKDFERQLEVSKFNRDTDIENIKNSLVAQQANQSAAATRSNALDRLYANILLAKAEAKDKYNDIDLTPLFQSLGALGKEQVLKNSANTNPAYDYSIGPNGEIIYKK